MREWVTIHFEGVGIANRKRINYDEHMANGMANYTGRYRLCCTKAYQERQIVIESEAYQEMLNVTEREGRWAETYQERLNVTERERERGWVGGDLPGEIECC